MQHNLRIGFIGMGLMGIPMSLRLLQAGFQVNVWNRNPLKTRAPEQAGAQACESLQQLVEASDVIMLCVTDTDAVENVVFGSNGLSQYLQPGQILVDFSSIAPQATQRFAKQLMDKHQCQWLDCPVSGGVAGAEAGTLVIMAGGNEETLNQVTPALQALSQRITHMGPSGSGQATKVCNQMLVSCNVMVMAEVLALAEKSGVDATKIPAALQGGFADSTPLQLTGTRMVNSDFDEIKWHVKTLLKDLNLADQLAQSSHSHTPMADLARDLMRQEADSGLGDMDPANLIRKYRHDA
jgi:3-hydroxyisobutyrate dehydrogenase